MNMLSILVDDFNRTESPNTEKALTTFTTITHMAFNQNFTASNDSSTSSVAATTSTFIATAATTIATAILSNNNNTNIFQNLPFTYTISSSSSGSNETSLLSNSINNDIFLTDFTNFTLPFNANNSTSSYPTTSSTTTTATSDIYSSNNNINSWQGVCLLFVYCIFIVITIIGNTLVILAVITTRRLRTVTNCFVMSLAIADLLVGIFVMPPDVALYVIGSWQLGWILCDIWISLDVLLCTASILSLCAISVDRYFAVTQPLTYSRKRRSKRLALTMILIVWLLALAITCPPILGWYEPGRRDLPDCRYNQNEGYVIFSAMGSFFIPMIVMIYVYARISCVIASRHDNMADISVHNKKNKRFHAVDVDAELDQDISEQDISPSQKKQMAARTLSNQTIGKDISDIIILEDNNGGGNSGGILTRQSTASNNNNKNGNYELINTSRTPSFKRQQTTLTVPKNTMMPIAVSSTATTATATPTNTPLSQQQQGAGGLSPTTNDQQWSYGAGGGGSHQQRHSVRLHQHHQHQHHLNTTCTNIGGGNDTYVTRNTRVVHHQKSLSNRISSVKKENKTTQTLSIVVGGFIACWLPFFIYYLINPFLNPDQISPPLFKFLTWLGWFNSAINPFIYAFYSVDFRAAFWRLTLKRFFGGTPKAQYPTNTMSIRR